MKYDVLGGADEAFILGRWLFLSSRLYHHLMVHQPSTYILIKRFNIKRFFGPPQERKISHHFPQAYLTHIIKFESSCKNVWGTA